METFDARGFSDQLNIATPELVELSFPIAGIGSRFVAVLIDTAIQVAVQIVGVIVLALIFAGSPSTASAAEMSLGEKWILAGFIFLYFCLYWGYFALFEAYWHGQTPGKRVMNIRVIKDSGRQITFFEALARNLVRVVDYLPSFYLIGIVTMLCNKANKRLGDLAAGTIVVHERRDEQPLFIAAPTSAIFAPRPVELNPWASAASTQGAVFPADAIARLGPQDLVVIEAFFARALELTLETRSTVAARIAAQMCATMHVALPEGNPERALEAIAHAMRGSARF